MKNSIWDRIPLWLRTAAFKEQEYENVRNEEMITIPDPEAPAETLRVAVAYLYINEKKLDSEKQADHVVGLYWKDMGGESDLFSKSYSDSDEAKEAYDNLKKELTDIQTAAQTDVKKAKELSKTLFDKNKLISNPNIDVTAPGSGSKVMTTLHEFTKGWKVVASEDGKPHVYFGFDFLEKALRKFEPVIDLPVQKPEIVYHTTTKEHCGLHNYVVSYWKKTLTKEGNIVRNVVQIERNDFNDLTSQYEGECIRIVRKNISPEQFDVICSSLTPTFVDYGLLYDKDTGKWIKTAKAVLQNLFFDTLEDLLKYQEEQKNLAGEPTRGKTEKLPEPKEGKESPVEEKEKSPSTISLEELEEKKMPESISPGEIGSPMETLEKVPSKTLPFMKSSLNIKSRLKIEDIKEGDTVIYRTEGKTIKGVVAKKYVENDTTKVDLAKPSNINEVFLKGCEEEIGSEGELISHFMRPEEWAAEKHREVQYNIEKAKGVLSPFEITPPSEILEERVTPEKLEEEEEVIEPEEGAPEHGEVELETFFRPLSNIEVKAALAQWITWPKGLPNTWMKEVYKKLGEPFKVGPTEDLKFPGLKVEVQELDEKRKRSEEAYKKLAEGKNEIAKKMKQIGSDIMSLNDDIKRAEVDKNDRAVTDLVEKKEKLQDQLSKLEEEFQRGKREYRRVYVDPEGFKQALIQLFYKYAPLSTAKVQLSEERDPATTAATSKKLREVMLKEKEIVDKTNKVRQQIYNLINQTEEKEDQLWEMFKSLPGYEYEAAIQQRINHVDSYFSDYLVRNPDPAPEIIEKFQDAIGKLEKERQEALQKSKLLPEHQSKADTLIKEIHDLRENIEKGYTRKEIEDLEKERVKIEQEKNKLQDEIGVIASGKIYLEIKGAK